MSDKGDATKELESGNSKPCWWNEPHDILLKNRTMGWKSFSMITFKADLGGGCYRKPC